VQGSSKSFRLGL